MLFLKKLKTELLFIFTSISDNKASYGMQWIWCEYITPTMVTVKKYTINFDTSILNHAVEIE